MGQWRDLEDVGQSLQKFQQAKGVGRPAANVENLAGDSLTPLISGLVETDEILSMKNVTDLFATPGDREWNRFLAATPGLLLLKGFETESAYPSLIEGGKLPTCCVSPR